MDDLRAFFHPESIAIVGVPRHEGRFGGRGFLGYLLEVGFAGRLYPINPNAGEILGLKAYPNLSSLPEVPHLVMVCVPAPSVPKVLEECARVGARHIHVFSSGFRETGTREGMRLEDMICSLAERHGLLIIGPNCMGPYCPSSRLTAWGAVPGMPGPLGVISQSGGFTQRITEAAFSLGVGTEKAVSFGNGTVLEAADFLEYFLHDERIRVIALYLESVRDLKRFRKTASRVAVEKPLVLLKGGKSPAGAATVSSHTGALAGKEIIWRAFARQTGMLEVDSLEEMIDAVICFAKLHPLRGRRIFIVGGGGGNSVVNADICSRAGLEISRISHETSMALRERVPPEGNIPGNPLDMWRTFHDPHFLLEVLELVSRDPSVDIILVDRLIPRKAFHTPESDAPMEVAAMWLGKRGLDKPVVFVVDYDGGDPELASKGASLRCALAEAGFVSFPSVKRAAMALSLLWRHAAGSSGP